MVQAVLNKLFKSNNSNDKIHKRNNKGNGREVETFDFLDKAKDELKVSVQSYRESITKIESVLTEIIEE